MILSWRRLKCHCSLLPSMTAANSEQPTTGNRTKISHSHKIESSKYGLSLEASASPSVLFLFISFSCRLFLILNFLLVVAWQRISLSQNINGNMYGNCRRPAHLVQISRARVSHIAKTPTLSENLRLRFALHAVRSFRVCSHRQMQTYGFYSNGNNKTVIIFALLFSPSVCLYVCQSATVATPHHTSPRCSFHFHFTIITGIENVAELCNVLAFAVEDDDSRTYYRLFPLFSRSTHE